ncbi:MAG: PQQ-dependent sugar dehydrogenase [Planctomycetes bacterium]|nr:PQQ-dependent sugar dehydrogenase [Planctomycetota bacterium]
MVSRTLLTTSIAGLCFVIAGKAIKPKAHTGQDPVISHTGQDPVRSLGTTSITTTRLVTGLSRPVQVVSAPNDYDRIFIVEQRSGSTGRVRIFNLDTGTLNSTAFLSLTVSTSSEQGLLGLAFHPNYEQNGFFYVNYTASNGDTYIKRYSVSMDPDVADSGSGYTILTIDQPYTNHNGGWLGFGPDGYLYIGTGDGGSGGDPGNRAQDITNQLLGKMLRIDVDGGSPYAIPASNPFVGITGDDEIWAYGLRNPWRCGFDRETGDLWMGDVGQNLYEEITFQPGSSTGGENYGWRCYEGNNSYNTSGCDSQSTMTFPVWEYSHSSGCSITGGDIYRGAAIPSLHGTYFFGDYCYSKIWSFRYDGSSVYDYQDRTSELSPDAGSIGSISGFGTDAAGEIYICDLGGEVFKIIPTPATGACCIGTSGTCIDIYESNCNAGGGTWLGPNTTCDDGGCDPNNCPADINGDGTVGVADILGLIDSWGPCSGCDADVNDDGVVDVTDMLEVVGSWGPC